MKLIALVDGYFEIQDDSTRITGTLPDIRKTMTENYGVHAAELQRGMRDMIARGNNVAVFGVNGTFIHSFSTSLDRKVRAELRAIQAVRKEFHALKSVNPDSAEAKQVYDRLMFLYFAQDIDGTLELLGEDTSGMEAA